MSILEGQIIMSRLVAYICMSWVHQVLISSLTFDTTGTLCLDWPSLFRLTSGNKRLAIVPFGGKQSSETRHCNLFEWPVTSLSWWETERIFKPLLGSWQIPFLRSSVVRGRESLRTLKYNLKHWAYIWQKVLYLNQFPLEWVTVSTAVSSHLMKWWLWLPLGGTAATTLGNDFLEYINTFTGCQVGCRTSTQTISFPTKYSTM